MPSVQILGLVTFIGLCLQTAAALLLAGVFWLLWREGGHKSYFLEWTRAWTALAIALLALMLRYLAAHAWQPTDLTSVPEDVVRAVHIVYQTGKFAFAGFLFAGAWRFARNRAFGRAGWPLAVLLAGGAVASVLYASSLERVLAWQAPVMIAGAAGAGITLLLVRAERRSLGSRLTAIILLVLASTWIGYGLAFSPTTSGPAWPDSTEPLAILAAFNGFFDLLIQVLLGSAMVVALMQDIARSAESARSESEKLQQELARADKLRALGNLVSGVTHEISNPLTAIVGFSEELATTQLSADAREMVQTIREQAMRCRSIVRNLSLFAGERRDRRVELDARELAERVARGFGPQLESAGVRLALDLPDARASLNADEAGIEQVLANLVSNAISAAGLGGTVRLSVQLRENEVEIAVVDDGPGVPADALAHVFEPFFTTKPPGQGTGLGLAMARGLVHSHSGTITVENLALPRHGARFVVRLPRAKDPSPTAMAREAAARQARQPSERALRILIVDDEETVRAVVRLACVRRGWQTVEAGDGEQALGILVSDRRFDTILCDLKMPRMTGIELHDRLARDEPQLLRRTVFLTGDTASPKAVDFGARTRCRIVLKPFDVAKLLDLLRTVAADADAAEVQAGSTPLARPTAAS